MTAYVTVVVAFLVFLELSVGQIRVVLKILIFAGMGVAAAGIGWFVFGGSANKFIPYNNLVVVCGLLVLVTVVAVKKLSDKFLVLLNRPVLAFGILVFTIEALWVNLSRPLNFQTPRLLGHLAFAVLLLSFGYVALQISFANERRLLSIEDELAVARRLQLSILPASLPDIRNVRIAVAYQPMTAVAGDFYEFIPVDRSEVGFLDQLVVDLLFNRPRSGVNCIQPLTPLGQSSSLGRHGARAIVGDIVLHHRMLEFTPLLKELNQPEITIRIDGSLRRRTVYRCQEKARDRRCHVKSEARVCPAKPGPEAAPH